MRHALTAFTTFRWFIAALAFAPSWATAETILQNDSLENMFDGTVSAAELIEGEMYEAVFQIPAEILPVEMLGVRVVMVRNPQKAGMACGRFGIEVWEEGNNATLTDTCPLISANVRYKDPGAQLFTQDSVVDPNTGTVLGFEVLGDDTRGNATFKDLRFSSINMVQGVTINPVVLETTTIRVAVRAMDLQCTAGGMIGTGSHFPILLSDPDNVARPLSNFVFGEAQLIPGVPLCNSGAPQHYAWEDFAPAFQNSLPGDFVMRLILNYDPNNMTPDMGMSTPDMGEEADMGMPPADMGTASDMGSPPSDMGGASDMSASNNGNNNTTSALTITSVTPDSGDNDGSTDIVIVGSGFLAGAEVLLDATAIGVTQTQSGRINATVPEGLDPATYDLVVTNPDGETAILMDGYTVTPPQTGGSSKGSAGGCCAQVPAQADGTPAALVLALLGCALVGRRRNR